jgi:hypothetical protein
LTEAVRYLQTARSTYVSGYVSAVVELARHAKLAAPQGPRLLVPFVKVFGEMLHEFERVEIEAALEARVIETYGCSENYGDGIAAHLADGVRAIFGEQCRVTVKPVAVAEIPREPSGKFRFYRASRPLPGGPDT